MAAVRATAREKAGPPRMPGAGEKAGARGVRRRHCLI
jgi:hypothetical protein